jgi:hypothetical protein
LSKKSSGHKIKKLAPLEAERQETLKFIYKNKNRFRGTF